MKLGIAMAGGGSKGSYELGVWQALRELDVSYDIVAGTSIGAVNGVLMVQNDFDLAGELWDTVTAETIMKNGLNLRHDMEYYFENRDQLLSLAKSYAASHGADISPYIEKLQTYIRPEAFFTSDVDFAVVTARFPSLQYTEVRKGDMQPDTIWKWVLASSACFPVFPLCEIDGRSYIDGGYTDNLPISAAFRMGAERVIAVALKQGVFEKKYVNHPLVTCIEPSRPLGGFMDFDRDILDRNRMLGYTDTMKTMGRFFGRVYALQPGGREVLRELMRDYFLWLVRWELAPPASRMESMLDRVRGETPVTDRILTDRTDDPLKLACMTLDYLMETLGYPHEDAYDVKTLLPALHVTLQASELPPELEEARALSYTLEKNGFSAVLAKAAPTHDSNTFLIATVMLYLRCRYGTQPEPEEEQTHV